MTSTADRLVEDYLERLDRELRDLPRARRRELVEEIEEHVAEARARLEGESEAELRTLLDRLGDPVDIAADARDRLGLRPRRGGALEIAALVGLLAGGFVFFVGWLVGLVLLWASEAWTVREKLLGTLVVPGGLATPMLLLLYGGTSTGGSEACEEWVDPASGSVILRCVGEGGGFGIQEGLFVVLFVFLVVGPIFTTVFLARRMRRPAVAPREASPGAA